MSTKKQIVLDANILVRAVLGRKVRLVSALKVVYSSRCDVEIGRTSVNRAHVGESGARR